MNAITSKRELDMLIDRDTQVLALFCASWCPFCQSFFVAFDREAAKLSFDSVVRVYIDDYDNPLWEEYSIEAVPTVILFEHEVSQRLDGRLGYGLTAKQFEAWLAKLHVTR